MAPKKKQGGDDEFMEVWGKSDTWTESRQKKNARKSGSNEHLVQKLGLEEGSPKLVVAIPTKVTANKTRKGDPVINLECTISRGSAKGTSVHLDWFFTATEKQSREEKELRFSADLRNMGIDTDELDDPREALADLIEAGSSLSISVQKNGPYVNANVKGLAQDKTKDEVDDTEDDGVSLVVDDSSPGEIVEAGDLALYKPPDQAKAVQMSVMVSDPDKETATLRDRKTKKTYEDVPWGKLEIVYE